jgi:hypothetical protein
MRGIHCGISRDSKTSMIWAAATGRIHNSRDVVFDERFSSTLAYTPNRFSCYLKILKTNAEPDYGLPFHQVRIFPEEHPSDDVYSFPQSDDEGTLEEIRNWRRTFIDGKERVLLLVRHKDETRFNWVDYAEFWVKHPKAVEDFFATNPFLRYRYPGGIVGLEMCGSRGEAGWIARLNRVSVHRNSLIGSGQVIMVKPWKMLERIDGSSRVFHSRSRRLTGNY